MIYYDEGLLESGSEGKVTGSVKLIWSCVVFRQYSKTPTNSSNDLRFGNISGSKEQCGHCTSLVFKYRCSIFTLNTFKCQKANWYGCTYGRTDKMDHRGDFACKNWTTKMGISLDCNLFITYIFFANFYRRV